MKKTGTLLLILFIATIANCQNFAPIGAKWTYTEYFFGGPGNDTLTIRSICDTLIQGKNCKKLVKSAQLCDLRSSIEFTYTDSGKVYFYDDLRSTFQMLYNFNAQVGDTYTILPGTDSTFINDSIKIIVDSVSTTTINSIVLKKIFVHQTIFQNWVYVGGPIVENIGDLYYMFPWDYGACDASFARPLRCYTDSIIGFYDFGTAPSCDYVDMGIIENKHINNVSIFPNPTTDRIVIDCSEKQELKMQIYNVIGECVLQRELISGTNEINVSLLSKGIYVIKLNSADWTVQRKLIKE